MSTVQRRRYDNMNGTSDTSAVSSTPSLGLPNSAQHQQLSYHSTCPTVRPKALSTAPEAPQNGHITSAIALPTPIATINLPKGLSLLHPFTFHFTPRRSARATIDITSLCSGSTWIYRNKRCWKIYRKTRRRAGGSRLWGNGKRSLVKLEAGQYCEAFLMLKSL